MRGYVAHSNYLRYALNHIHTNSYNKDAMSDERVSFSEEQLSELLKRQRHKGAERTFGYVFASSILAAIVVGLAYSHLDAGQSMILTATVLISAAAYAMVTSN